jgi:dihydroorotate dehydrogenase
MSIRGRALQVGYERLLRPVLFSAHGGDPEKIHEDMIRWLAVLGHSPGLRDLVRLVTRAPAEPVEVFGVRFPGRVGLAAGMDKDGLAALAWQHLGFAFAELGTVTAQPQPGNEKPRVFRLRQSGAIINRMGFNNSGALALANRLAVAGVFRGNLGAGIPIGISLGKTKVVPVEDAVADYLDSFETVAPHADYVAVNVSSPNTPGLRSLQDGGALGELLGALTARAEELAFGSVPVPVLVKVAPDLTWGQLDEVMSVASDTGVAGIIATNTTLAREGLVGPDQALASQAGGLSGRPLTFRAREVVAYLAQHTSLPIIGAGGIMSSKDAAAMFDEGARLIQLYTGFIYGGPALIGAINQQERSC